MKKGFTAILAVGITITSFAYPQAPLAAPGAPVKGVNPLIEEMRALDKTFTKIVSAVALGDGEKVHKALKAMHGRKEKTLAGLHAGEVKPPKNPQLIAEFEQMDMEFHYDLEMLAASAEKNDRQNMLAVTKRLLERCVNCHQTFRN